jgi:hypothetical protein
MYLAQTLEESPIDMSRFDVTNAARIANDLLPSITDPRRRKILVNFRDHALAECCGDYDALMATCSKKSQRYETHGAAPEFAALQPRDYEQLCGYYGGLIDANMYLIHFDVEKLIVGDDELVVEGIVHQLMDGRTCREIHDIDDLEDDTVYQTAIRTLVIFIFDQDGMGCGEHAYSSALRRELLTPVAPEEVPPQFYEGPGKAADFVAAHPDWPVA